MILYTYSLVSQDPVSHHGRADEFFASLAEARQAVRVLRNEVIQDAADWTPVRIETIEIAPIVASRSLARLLNEGIISFIQRHETIEVIS